MPDLRGNDTALRQVLMEARAIAVVGHSDKSHRTSYQIAQFLRRAGYQVYPVNPTVQTIDGQPSYPSVQAIPEPIDIVNVFRRPDQLMAVVEDAIAAQAKTLWTQWGVVDPASAQAALAADLNVIMDACIKVEYLRLKI